jgi:hypothetical protein
MKTWPDFNNDGDLPVGVHQATLDEVTQLFGKGSLRREMLARRLERIHGLARSTGHLARFIVFGSFVTETLEPNDDDIFMLLEDTFDSSAVTGEAAIIFDHMAAQNIEGASVFWIRRMAAIGGEEAAIEDWQVKRDNKKRGIVEVVTNA